MNKDVIYIEPEDDITDIISKLEKSQEKIVALVPPQKAGVLRSVVNVKLLAKAASGAAKTLVFVTTDPSIIKLAALVHLPVTKDLQTVPTIPTQEEEIIEVEEVSEINAESNEIPEKPEVAKSTTENSPKNSSKSSPKWISWIKDHKKLVIACLIILILLIGVLVWAFVIAPAVTISVTIRTTSKEFSENISLVSDLSSENASSGIFYYETKTKDFKQEASFTATGSKNIGEKATGTLVIYASFPVSAQTGSTSVSSDATFSFNGLKYYLTEDVSLRWDGKFSSCNNASSINSSGDYCTISTEVQAIAAEPGSSYNIPVSTSGWTVSTSSVNAYARSAFTGGTDNIVTVVTQEDIDKAKESLSTDGHSKEAFLDEVSENETLFVISQSYKESDEKIVSTPAVGEKVETGVTPKLSITTTASVFTIDKTKVEEFIFETAKLDDDQKIYSIGNPFIESFAEKESGYSGKLKTTYIKGSKVTEEEILKNVKGKKVGEVKAILSSITGVVKDSTKIETSFFWVSSVPNDPNKITINLNIEE